MWNQILVLRLYIISLPRLERGYLNTQQIQVFFNFRDEINGIV